MRGRARPLAAAPPLAALAALVAVATASPAVGGTAVEDGGAGRWFRFEDPAIDESSGLAASRVTPGLLWTHNDSGGAPVLYAVDPATGATRAELRLDVEARDWEDLAAGPGPDGRPSLFVGDIGDNTAEHPSVTVHVVPEPDLAPGATVTAETPTTYRFVYEDGPHDAETLLVHPATGRIAIVTKDLSGRAGVYLAPESPDPVSENLLTFAATARFTIPEDASDSQGPIGRLGYYLATGGDVSPDGTRVVVRSYGEAREWPVVDGDLAAAFAIEPTVTPLPDAPQGEAITYTLDGAWLVASSEGERAVVDRVRPAETLVVPTEQSVSPTDPDPTPPDADEGTGATAPAVAPDTSSSDPTRAIVTVALAALAILVLGVVLARRAR